MANERLVKQKVKKILQENEAWFCMPVGGPYGKRGVPDILALIDSMFLAIECKSGNNKPTELQKQQLRKIRTAGGLSMVVSERNLQDFSDLIAKVVSSPTSAVRLYWAGRWKSLTEPFDP